MRFSNLLFSCLFAAVSGTNLEEAQDSFASPKEGGQKSCSTNAADGEAEEIVVATPIFEAVESYPVADVQDESGQNNSGDLCPNLSPAMKQALRASIAVAGAAGWLKWGAGISISSVVTKLLKDFPPKEVAVRMLAENCLAILVAQLINMKHKPYPVSESTMWYNMQTLSGFPMSFISSFNKGKLWGLPWFAWKVQFYRRLSNYLLGDKFFDPEGEAEMIKSAQASSEAE